MVFHWHLGENWFVCSLVPLHKASVDRYFVLQVKYRPRALLEGGTGVGFSKEAQESLLRIHTEWMATLPPNWGWPVCSSENNWDLRIFVSSALLNKTVPCTSSVDHCPKPRPCLCGLSALASCFDSTSSLHSSYVGYTFSCYFFSQIVPSYLGGSCWPFKTVYILFPL